MRVAWIVPFMLAGSSAVVGQSRALLPEHRRELAELQPRIDAAMDRGVRWLLDRQQRDGSWEHAYFHYEAGQTALAVYTLLRLGLRPDHAAIRRGVTHLSQFRPTKVYATGTHLMAFGALADPAHRDHVEDLVSDLIRWHDGTWRYPNSGTPRDAWLHADRDLSVTQFGVLGLRAARSMGVPVPRKLLVETFDDVLDYQEPETTVESSGVRRALAGFRYRWSVREPSSGSMTTAGVASLCMLRGLLGEKLGARRTREAERAIALATGWLDHHYSVVENPGKKAAWLYYYLYGLERVGSLLGTEYLGAHPWYLDGAKVLVDEQAEDGGWPTGHAVADTCFALCFLERATAPATGARSDRLPMTVVEGEDTDVGMRILGGTDGSDLRIWITRIGEVGARDPEAGRLRVAWVEYEVGGEVLARVEGDLERPWGGEPLPARRPVTGEGALEVRAVVRLASRGADGTWAEAEEVRSKLVTVVVRDVHEPWMQAAAVARSRNLLTEKKVTVTCSSEGAGRAAVQAVDGREGSAWFCESDDAEPWWRLECQGVRANTIRLTHGAAPVQRGKFDRATRIAYRVNRDRNWVEVSLGEDERRPTFVDLGRTRKVSALEIRILGRVTGSGWPGAVGFAEVGLEKR